MDVEEKADESLFWLKMIVETELMPADCRLPSCQSQIENRQ
jgi:hypothetical protein